MAEEVPERIERHNEEFMNYMVQGIMGVLDEIARTHPNGEDHIRDNVDVIIEIVNRAILRHVPMAEGA